MNNITKQNKKEKVLSKEERHKKLLAMTDEDIDYSDIPEIDLSKSKIVDIKKIRAELDS